MGNEAVDIVFRVIDLLGVGLNGVLGGKLARQKRFDAVGFIVLALMSAMAGGIIRDLMLQAGAPVAITDPYYIGTAILGASIAFLWRMDSKFWRVALIIADGTVLGCWAATGAMKTLSVGFGILPAILLGITTAVGGGMIRDVTAGNVPTVFGGNNLYATPAFVSAGIMVVLFSFGLPMWGMIAATVIGSSFTVLAHWRHWRLPVHSDWSLSLTPAQLKHLLSKRGGMARDSGSPKDSELAGLQKELDEVDKAQDEKND